MDHGDTLSPIEIERIAKALDAFREADRLLSAATVAKKAAGDAWDAANREEMRIREALIPIGDMGIEEIVPLVEQFRPAARATQGAKRAYRDADAVASAAAERYRQAECVLRDLLAAGGLKLPLG
jgi:hypothetical protein